jgi:hypothetical protein
MLQPTISTPVASKKEEMPPTLGIKGSDRSFFSTSAPDRLVSIPVIRRGLRRKHAGRVELHKSPVSLAGPCACACLCCDAVRAARPARCDASPNSCSHSTAAVVSQVGSQRRIARRDGGLAAAAATSTFDCRPACSAGGTTPVLARRPTRADVSARRARMVSCVLPPPVCFMSSSHCHSPTTLHRQMAARSDFRRVQARLSLGFNDPNRAGTWGIKEAQSCTQGAGPFALPLIDEQPPDLLTPHRPTGWRHVHVHSRGQCQ